LSRSFLPDQISRMGGRTTPRRVLSYRFHVAPCRPAFPEWNVQRQIPQLITDLFGGQPIAMNDALE